MAWKPIRITTWKGPSLLDWEAVSPDPSRREADRMAVYVGNVETGWITNDHVQIVTVNPITGTTAIVKNTAGNNLSFNSEGIDFFFTFTGHVQAQYDGSNVYELESVTATSPILVTTTGTGNVDQITSNFLSCELIEDPGTAFGVIEGITTNWGALSATVTHEPPTVIIK